MKYVPLYIDLAFCIIVLPVMILLFPIERWFHNFQLYVICIGLWLYCLYFLNRSITVPALFKGKRRAYTGILLIAVSLLVTYVLARVSLYTPKPNIHDIGIARMFPYIQQYQQAVWSLFMIVETFSFAVGLLTQINEQRSRRQEAEVQRDKAEIAMYKAQIKPHFMFNTLNTLYGLFLTRDNKALPALEKFISMTRYVHMASSCEMIPLSDEADYIRQYVELQSLRLNQKTCVKTDISINGCDMHVPPMLLITFVENCFKHGVSPVEPSSIDISLRADGRKMEFLTSNRIFPVRKIGEHIGIENCRKRLELLYPGRYRLDIETSEERFTVRLEIN